MSVDADLAAFLSEADKSVMSPTYLKKRAKAGDAYAGALLADPSSKKGQKLFNQAVEKETLANPAAAPQAAPAQPEVVYRRGKRVTVTAPSPAKVKVPTGIPSAIPLPVDPSLSTPTKTKPGIVRPKKIKNEKMRTDLSEKQITMQKRMSNPSSTAMSQLWTLGDQLTALQAEILAIRATPDKPLPLMKAKTTLAALNGRLETFEFAGLDAIVTTELASGRTEARDERRRLTLLAEETHELIHLLALELKERYENTGPDLALSKKFFREQTIPMRVVKKKDPEKENQKDEFRKLEPGEYHEDAEPYSVWATPVNEIGDFGIGILLYFKMLISLTILCTVLGLASIYNIHYFDTDEYSNSQPSLPNFSILHGSAVCDNYEPVCTADPCTCTYTDGDPTIVGSDCAVRFNCPLRLEQGYADLVIAAAFLLFNIYMGFKHAKITTKADEAEQTAQDYAIMVNDPNPDATDPDEWHKFFKQFGHVSYVTVAINNGKLLRLLSRRKQCMQMLGYESGQKKKTEDERAEYDVAENDELYQALSPAAKKLSGIVQWRYRMSRADDQIELAVQNGGRDFVATKVFVVFEKEAYQRAALTHLTVGKIPAMMDTNSSAILPRYIFRSTNVLDVCEAPEPTDVIWENLETSLSTRLLQMTITFLFSVGLVIGCAFFIYWMYQVDDTGFLAAFFISFTNAVVPVVLKAVNDTEQHLTQGSRQTSLLLKLVFLRWTTTGFIGFIFRSETLSEDFVGKIWSILLADALTTPLIRLFDPVNRLKMRFWAGKASSQEKMNSYFTGTGWFLAERYTDMTKTIFVSLFYNALFPAGLFVTCLAFFVSYWVDKYCLFRLWKQPPAMDGTLAAAARFQISLVFLLHCAVTFHFFSGWPFDNLTQVAGTSTMTLNDEVSTEPLYASVDHEVYNIFNFYRQDWHTDDQFFVVRIYAILNIAACAIFAFYYFGQSANYSFYALFYGSYVPVGAANDDDFSFVPGIQTYVPMISNKSLPQPLLATDLTLMDREHISFTVKDYTPLELTKSNVFSVKGISKSRQRSSFAACKQYKSARVLEQEIANVEVDMETIIQWEKDTMAMKKKELKKDMKEVGGIGVTGETVIGGVKDWKLEEQRQLAKKSMFGFGASDHEL